MVSSWLGFLPQRILRVQSETPYEISVKQALKELIWSVATLVYVNNHAKFNAKILVLLRLSSVNYLCDCREKNYVCTFVDTRFWSC